MKVLCLIALFFTSLSFAQNQNELKLVHLQGPIYVVEDYFYNRENSAVYIGENYVTVIGATWTPKTAKLLKNEIKKITDKPIKEVINTNYHPDRAGGNAFFKEIGASIYSTQLTFQLLKDHWDEMVDYTRKGIPTYPKIPLVMPDKIYPGDFTLQDGRVKALYLGPSHTADGIFVYFPNERVLYGGCILKEYLGNLDFANIEEYPKTLKKLKSLKIDKIIAGHWSSVHGPDLIDKYIALLEENKNKKISR